MLDYIIKEINLMAELGDYENRLMIAKLIIEQINSVYVDDYILSDISVNA